MQLDVRLNRLGWCVAALLWAWMAGVVMGQAWEGSEHHQQRRTDRFEDDRQRNGQTDRGQRSLTWQPERDRWEQAQVNEDGHWRDRRDRHRSLTLQPRGGREWAEPDPDEPWDDERWTSRGQLGLGGSQLDTRLRFEQGTAEWDAFWREQELRERQREAVASERLYPAVHENRWGYMTSRGYWWIRPQFAWTDYFYSGQARAVQDGKTGFINAAGRWFQEPVYEWADRFAEGYAIIREDRKYGFINLAHDQVTPIAYDEALRFQEGLAGVRVKDKMGFVDPRTGEMAIIPQFTRIRSFFNGLAMVETTNNQDQRALGYIDKRGEFVFRDDDRRFRDLGDFTDTGSLAPARTRDGWGFIDRTFEFWIEPRYQDARWFMNGLAAVKEDGKWGYIDKRGQMVIEPQFEQAYEFQQSLALVKIDGYWGHINRIGDFVIEPVFERAHPRFRDFIRVYDHGGRWSTYLNVAGQAIDNAWLELRDRPWVEQPYEPEYLYEPELPRQRR